jgi:hypothetical protein
VVLFTLGVVVGESVRNFLAYILLVIFTFVIAITGEESSGSLCWSL